MNEELQRQNPAGKSLLPAEGEQTVGTSKQTCIELGLRRYSDTQSAVLGGGNAPGLEERTQMWIQIRPTLPGLKRQLSHIQGKAT